MAEKTNDKKSKIKKATAAKKSTKTVSDKNASSVKKTVTKASATKKVTTKTATKNTTSTKKSTTKLTTVTKTTKTKKAVAAPEPMEYYDLPYRYNKTIVRILSQTPNRLFVYWDISDEDRKVYEQNYGADFFHTTKPVLIVHNTTKNYSFELELNDFANSWYFNVEDENCKYVVELGRRPISNEVFIPNNYVHITASNTISAPNDHILFEPFQDTPIVFRNVKTNEETTKNIVTLTFFKNAPVSIRKMNNIVSEIYNEIYKNTEISTINNPHS